jgi:16S rRNA (uracil1498-N3)-methyltransferase
MTLRRFVVAPGAIQADRVRFDPEEAHHLAHVLRLRPGAVIEAVDGTGRVYTVRLEMVAAGKAWGVIVGEVSPSGESPCAITLAQAILKGDRMAWLVQKATELGVTRIVPLETARVVAHVSGEGGAGRRRRWERVAREALKQCGRSVLPVVDPPRTLGEVLAGSAGHEAVWLCWEGGGTPASALARRAGRVRRLLLLVGPEGGFTDDEVARAQAAGASLVGLGPRILRAESAGLVAVTLGQHLFGDLGADSPGEGK